MKFLASLVLYGFWGGHIGMQISGMGEVRRARDFFISYRTTEGGRSGSPGPGSLEARGSTTVLQAWDVPPGETLVARMRDAPQEADLGG